MNAFVIDAQDDIAHRRCSHGLLVVHTVSNCLCTYAHRWMFVETTAVDHETVVLAVIAAIKLQSQIVVGKLQQGMHLCSKARSPSVSLAQL